MEKREIRKEILQLRNKLKEDYRILADDKIYHRLTDLEYYRQAKIILSYVSYRSEVNTKRILQKALADGKIVAVPKVLDKNGIMEFYEIHSLQELVTGYQGIEEPDIKEKEPVDIEGRWENILMIMPGAAFDHQCSRIGYGGGFYDRYLNRYRSRHMKTIAVCYEIQVVDDIPAEPLDVKPDMVLTERHIFER